ncbi:MAG: sugar transferase, partial [Actinomycetota bacterium]|nr:sugar transferase [Actinomycetota bacterium]
MPTTERPLEGSTEATAQSPTSDFPLSERDVRRKRPPVLSFLLRLDTLRSVVRVGTLFMLDAIAIYMAILTALWLKAGLLTGAWQARAHAAATDELFDFACLLTVLLFARSGLYSARGERPGMSRIVSSLAQVALVALVYAVASGHQFSSYYLFYGSLFFAVIYVSLMRLGYEKLTGAVLRAAGYQRRAVLVGSGQHIEAVGHALRDA